MLNPEYIPPKLIARDEQIKQVASLFRPMLGSGAPHNAMIYGLPGTGKSVVIRYVLKKLNQTFIKRGLDKKVSLVTAKCNVTSTSKVLASIVSQLDPGRIISERGITISSYIDDVFRILNSRDESLILVLDEFDKLPQTDILYPFVRAGEQGTLKTGLYISIIGISNDIYFYSTMDPRIKSSMEARSIIFRSYFAPELVDILNGRRGAFREGALQDEVIPYCASVSAQEKGDAREAIQLLKGAGDIADEERGSEVTIDHVRRAKEILDQTPDGDAMKALPPTHKMGLCAYVLLKDLGKGDIWTRDLYDMYVQVAHKLDSKEVGIRRFSVILSEMEMIGIISAIPRSRGRQGQSRQVYLVPTVEGIRAALRQDEVFRSMVEKVA